MSLIVRIWAALTGVIAATVGILAVLVILQHDAILSQLIRQRLAVTVEATARPFRSVVELGLPVSMMRNKQALLERARETDPAIRSVVLFNPSGIVVERSGSYGSDWDSQQIVEAQTRDITGRWGIETASDLVSGTSILGEDGTLVGGVFAIYPKTELQTRSAAVAREIILAAAAIVVFFSGLAYLAVRIRAGAVVSTLRRLEGTLAKLGNTGSEGSKEVHEIEPGGRGKSASQIPIALVGLGDQLGAASARYQQILRALGVSERQKLPQLPGARETLLVGIPERAATRSFARRLSPIVAALALGSAIALGYVAYFNISDSFRPEIVRRMQLIGAIATADIQRSVEAGVPLTSLAGGAEYLSHLLSDFPEISYFAVLAEGPLLEVGDKRGTGDSEHSVFPIEVDGKAFGSIVTVSDPDYVARQFRDLVIDLGVVLLVIVLFCFELIVVMMTRSVTGPLDRLQHLAELQADGDFSKRLLASGRNVIERLGTLLSERSEQLAAVVAQLSATTKGQKAFRGEGAFPGGLAVAGQPPAIMRFCSLTDVRLPLFLFAMADELPLSFFSLFARAQINPFGWLGEGVVIGLPLVAYLGAALLGAPVARPLGQWLGYRRLFVAAALSTFAAKLGLYYAQTIVEVIFFSGINGLAFVLAMLACQDYVLDMLPKAARSRSISLFRATMFSGVFAATALGGILADRLGQRPVFIVCAVLSVIAAVLIWRMLPTVHANAAQPQIAEQQEAISFNVFAPMRSAAFAAVALGSVIPLAIVDHVFISYLLALQMDALGANVSEIARVMMCFFLALILGGYAEGRLPTWLAAPGILLTFCSLLTGAALISASLMDSTWTTTIAAVCAGAALGVAGGPQTALVLDSAEGPLRNLGSSTVLGTIRVIERGGAIVGLLLVGWLTDTLGYSGAVGIIGLASLAGAGLFVLLRLVGNRGTISGRRA